MTSSEVIEGARSWELNALVCPTQTQAGGGGYGGRILPVPPLFVLRYLAPPT